MGPPHDTLNTVHSLLIIISVTCQIPVQQNQMLIFKIQKKIICQKSIILHTTKKNAAPKAKLHTALNASTSKLGRLLAVTFPGISMNMLWIFNYGTILLPKARLLPNNGRLKNLPPSIFIVFLYFLCLLVLRLNCVQTCCKANSPAVFTSVSSTPQTRLISVSCPV